MICPSIPHTRARERLHRKAVRACGLILSVNILFLLYRILTPEPVETRSHGHHRRRCASFVIDWEGMARVRFESRMILKDYDLLPEESQARQRNDSPKQPVRIPAIRAANKTHDEEKKKKMPLCAYAPPNLQGEMKCECEPVNADQLVALWPQMERGGRLRPSHCKPRERLAVIITYRDRYTHLHTLLSVLIPLLIKQEADVTFFVVEQAAPSIFNRGTLQNIGFLESQKLGSFNCFIFHDVDLVPMDDRILYRCGDKPRHLAVAIKRYGYKQAKVLYRDHFGGIVGLSKNQYIDVNGNSNLYFGWGGEDDDLYLRVVNKGYTKDRGDPTIYKYQMLKHVRNDKGRGNVDRKVLLRTAEDRQDEEGLSTTYYTVNYVRQEPLYTWINVSFNMSQLILTAPDFTLRSIRSLVELSKTIS